MSDFAMTEEMWVKLLHEIDKANPRCHRCKRRWREHRGADHLFFDHPDDAPDQENN